MKQLELMLTSGELSPRHQHTVTLYAKGLTCKADTLGSGGYVYLAVYPTWLRLSGCLSDTGTRNHLITPNISPLALPVTENLR